MGVAFAQNKRQSSPPPTGDVFASGSSANNNDDRSKYISKDGRWFDRCGFETDNMDQNPYTKQYGPPDHVPIDRQIMNQYVRCAVDSCAVNEKAVCWGKKTDTTPVPPDEFNFNSIPTNCQPYGADKVICDAPKLNGYQPIRRGSLINAKKTWDEWSADFGNAVNQRQNDLLVNDRTYSNRVYYQEKDKKYISLKDWWKSNQPSLTASFRLYANGRVENLNTSNLRPNPNDTTYDAFARRVLTSLSGIPAFPDPMPYKDITWNMTLVSK